jgi:hypothetical protein
MNAPARVARAAANPVAIRAYSQSIMDFLDSVSNGQAVAPLALGFLVIFLSTEAPADSVTLTPNADAELREASALGSFGTGTTMVSGGLGFNSGTTKRRALLRFELADQIPPGATITSVELELAAVSMLPPTPVSSNFGLHRLLRPWSETAVTWSWTDGPTAPWGAGGAGREDDAVSTASATVRVTGLGVYTFASTPELVADVQQWLNDPASNDGWLLRSDTELPFTARHFGTREHATSPARLTVSYESAATLEPVTLGEVTVVEGQLTFSFEAVPGTGYRVEFRQTLTEDTWQTLTNLPPVESVGTVNVRHAIQGMTGWYRVESTVVP